MALAVQNSPKENYLNIIKILRFSASICGIDLLKENYRMNWITYTLFTSIVGYFGFVFYTILTNYKDDWTIFLRASVTIGTACQGVSKLFTFISNKDVIFNMHKELLNIYGEYENKGRRYREALNISVTKTRNGMLSLMLFYVIGYFGVLSMPYLWMILFRERFLVLDFHIPGLDISTDLGYFITMAFQTVLVICFSFGLYCGDLVALVYLLQSFMFSNIFAAKVESLNELLQQKKNLKNYQLNPILRDIVLWHQLFSVFIEKCNDLFYYVITVQIISAFCSTVISVFLIVIGAWPGAYMYLIIAISCLYLYCILGTENETAILQFEQNIYKTHWYYMTVPQQKIILQVLFKTQHPQSIDVAGVMPLSVNTALQLTKTVYSITMAMIQFVSE